MGMFDSLLVKCRDCKNDVEFQSKAGECGLNNYTIADAPDRVLVDLANESQTCKCGNVVTIRAKTIGFVEQ